MKKALVCIILSLALLLALTACGKVQAEQPPAEPEPEPVSDTDPAVPVEDDDPPEQADSVIQEQAETAEPETPEPEPDETDVFTEVNETVYATGTVNMRSGPGTQYDKLGQLAAGDEVLRIGIGIADTEAEGWSMVKLADGTIAYISSNYLSTTKPAPAQQATGGKAATGGGTVTGGATGSSKTTKQPATDSSAPDLGVAGWKQDANGNWYLGTKNSDTSGPATSQPTDHSTPGVVYTDDQHDRAGSASARVNKGEQELKYDEEGGFYYYEY